MIACCALWGSACTVIVSADEEQCASDADCVDRGFPNAACVDALCVDGAGDPIWGCLGNVVEPDPDPTQTVEFPIRLVYATDGTGVGTDAVVDICDKLDVGCTGADPKFPKGLSPDADGTINVVVPEGFDGFVRVTHTEIVDARVYVGRPLLGPPGIEEVQLFRPIEFDFLAAMAGQTPDPDRGTAIVLAVDCQGGKGSGVRLETPNGDGETLEWYLVNQTPTPPPTANATDVDGFGGFFNLPTGGAVVRAYREEDDAYIGESSFQILADTISFVQVAPTPQ